ncbi:sulfate adenylyltransferase subunit 1 [Thermoflexibacter ruber]|uniref:sulfate adenylyltransferase n=1 Tax=Thermoflexibacter ruber TaxID=1003 RepID=A0A1I2BMB6_9BACT|nr:GTP-binding protein [Thermoflexibacter ruber]SFE56413.1 sulfate adenylyltransferase subunit 1 [Thermoflexibacter ruber]
MNVLKLATAGSVDDGKSTLIGRLLYDTESLTKDRLEAVERASRRKGLDFTDLSLLTDGLVAEREQGITIDVAHIYFHTNKRKFILADTPGHIEYTRNMITGASNSELSIILIDARKGVVEQTYRHFFINTLLRVPHIIVCVNKMDLVDYSEEVFYKIASDFQKLANSLSSGGAVHTEGKGGAANITFIPVSALHGDNIANLSEKMPWYIGKPLLEILEEVDTDKDWNSLPARFPVQYVIRRDDKEFPDYRSYAGKVISGTFQVGDRVMVLPNQLESTITEIRLFEDTLNQAFAHDSIAISLADEIDISRGSMIVKSNAIPLINKDLRAKVCWLSENPYRLGTTFILKHASSEVKAKIQEISYKVDIENFGQAVLSVGTRLTSINEFDEPVKINEIKLNDIVKVHIRTAQPIFYDLYAENKANGAFILIDSQTNATVAVGFLE